MAVLLTPKLLGLVLLCRDRQMMRRFGGLLRVSLSVLFETVVSALLAPVMMVMQSAVVLGTLTGRDVGWRTQRRDDGSIPWRAVARQHRLHTLYGVVLAIVAYAVSPPFLAWLSPVVVGLVLAIPVSATTGQQALGRAIRRLGLLLTPEETTPPGVLQRANALAAELANGRAPVPEPFTWLASNTALRTLHAAMLPTTPERRKGEYDADLLLGLAKLQDANSLEEASALLSGREKLMVLAHRAGFERLCQLVMAHRQ
jgi:membrane glycosyltransferase